MRFETFVTGQAAALLRHATIVSADPHQAPDLVQAVLERALARWAKIDDLDRPDLYVRRMVVNEFLSVRRRWRRTYPTDVVRCLNRHPTSPAGWCCATP
jgi:DNA-directed RNA polymerase specialized sigma24 family protein